MDTTSSIFGNILTLHAGGTELTKQMDDTLGLSKIIQSMNIKKKGLPLEKIALSLVSARIDKPDSVWRSVEHIKQWSSALTEFDIDHDKVHPKTYYRGLEALGENADNIYSQVMNNVDGKFGLDMNYVFMDWTSSYLDGNKCKLAKHGYSKDHRPDRPQVKIGLATTAGKAIPFHFSVENGNLVDAPHFRKDYKAIEPRLPKDALIVFDKGAKSKGNCKLIRESGHDYLSAIKDTAELRAKIEQIDKNSMLELFQYETGDKVFGYWNRNSEGVYGYIYYDERRAKKDAKKRQKKIKKLLKEKEELTKKIQEKGAKALTKKKRKKVTKELNDVVITTEVTIQKRLAKKSDEEIIVELEADKDLDGIFTLESSRNLKPKSALRLYRRKDKIEKLISDLKNVHMIRPFRVWTDNAIKGAILICMIATLFVGLLQQALDCLRNTKKTVVEHLKHLTLIIEFDNLGNIAWKKLGNVTKFLSRFLNLSPG